MEEHLTPERIANAIMLDNSFKGYFLIVEGIKDTKFFQKYINRSSVRIKEAFGNMKVKEVFRILTERGFDRKIGIIDSDFNVILEIYEKTDGIFITDDHDVEMMIIKTQALEAVVNHFCDIEKINAFEKKVKMSIRQALLQLGKEIGFLKLANKIHDLGLVFKPENADGNYFKYKDFIEESTLKFLGEEKLVETLINYSRNKSTKLKKKDVIVEQLNNTKKMKCDDYHLANGHDVSQIIYVFLKKTLRCKSRTLVDFNSIEDNLVLAYEYSDFKKTSLFQELFKWHNKNDKVLFKDI